MLKEADSYQGGGEVDGEAGGKVKDADALFSKLKWLVKSDEDDKAGRKAYAYDEDRLIDACARARRVL